MNKINISIKNITERIPKNAKAKYLVVKCDYPHIKFIDINDIWGFAYENKSNLFLSLDVKEKEGEK